MCAFGCHLAIDCSHHFVMSTDAGVVVTAIIIEYLIVYASLCLVATSLSLR